MNENGNKYAMAALKDRRARVAGEVFDLRRQIFKKNHILAHLDETIKLFDPDYKVGSIRPKKAYQHVRLFGRGELQRLVLGVLREANGQPMPCNEIAAAGAGKIFRSLLSRNPSGPGARDDNLGGCLGGN